MPKVSVIVPNYNYARFLHQRLDTIFAQTYQDFEVIILDDASTDGSGEVIADYACRPNVRVVANVVNSGSPFAQWNRGLAFATGEYIWIAEADDYAAPTLLERLVERLATAPQVGLAYTQSILVDERGTMIGTGRQWTDSIDSERWQHDFVNDGRRECGMYMHQACTIHNVSAVLLRRSILDVVGAINESAAVSGDYEAYLKMLLRSDISFIAEPLNYFRRHPTSAYSIYDALRRAEQMYNTIIYLVEAADLLEAAAPGSKGRLAGTIWGSWMRYVSLGQDLDIPALEAQLKRTMKRLGWKPSKPLRADLHAVLLFASHRARRFDLVRRYLPVAMWSDLKLLLNIGVWSMAAQAFLGLHRRR